MTTIAVCVPCRDEVHSTFAFDLTRACAYHARNTQDKILLFSNMGTLICNQRQELAFQALKAGAEWILYFDSDMRFPIDVIGRLLAHGEDVVAANYSTRRHPVHPVAFCNEKLDDYVYTKPSSTGLEEVVAVGMGVCMVRAEILKDLELPWFAIGYRAASNEFTGEDIFFCRRLKAAGHKILIDHDLSKEVAHVGTWEYRPEHACLALEAVDHLQAAE